MTAPAANTAAPAPFQVMPRLTADDHESLKASIVDKGVLVPVEYDDAGNILDGHHRVAICQELGITEWPKVTLTKYKTELEKRDYAYTVNMNRRHMSREEKRQHIANYLRDNPDKSDRQVAAVASVDHKTVASVRAESESCGEIPHVETRTDSKGRQQPATKASKAVKATAATAKPAANVTTKAKPRLSRIADNPFDLKPLFRRIRSAGKEIERDLIEFAKLVVVSKRDVDWLQKHGGLKGFTSADLVACAAIAANPHAARISLEDQLHLRILLKACAPANVEGVA